MRFQPKCVKATSARKKRAPSWQHMYPEANYLDHTGRTRGQAYEVKLSDAPDTVSPNYIRKARKHIRARKPFILNESFRAATPDGRESNAPNEFSSPRKNKKMYTKTHSTPVSVSVAITENTHDETHISRTWGNSFQPQTHGIAQYRENTMKRPSEVFPPTPLIVGRYFLSNGYLQYERPRVVNKSKSTEDKSYDSLQSKRSLVRESLLITSPVHSLVGFWSYTVKFSLPARCLPLACAGTLFVLLLLRMVSGFGLQILRKRMKSISYVDIV